MGRIIGILVLLLATLTLGGCAGLPLGALANGAYGGAYGGYGGGYGGGCAQPYGAAGGIPVPVPMDPGYAAGAAGGVYAPQPQPYYGAQPYAYNYNGTVVYGPGSGPGQADQLNPRWSSAEVQQRLQNQDSRIQAALNSGQLTPEQAQRLQAEQGHIQQAMTRMQADGRLSPWELGRLNHMLNRSNQDIYGTIHNGTATQPGTNTAGQHWNGNNHNGATAQPGANPTGQPGNGITNNGPMAAQGARHMGPNGPMGQPGVGPMAQYRRGPIGQPGMAGPQNMGGARFQPRPMAPRPQAVQPRQATQQRRTPGI